MVESLHFKKIKFVKIDNFSAKNGIGTVSLKCKNFLIDEKSKLEEVITEIHQKLDAIYVFGIGSKIDMNRLNSEKLIFFL